MLASGLFLLLPLSALVDSSAAETTGKRTQKGAQKNLLTPGTTTKPSKTNSNALGLADAVSDACFSTEEACDALWCIPDGEVCCDDGDGAFCGAGTYCTPDGCCREGSVCRGGYDDDDDDRRCGEGLELCGDGYCIPRGAVCCGESGSYCDEGEVCTDDGFCGGGCRDGQEECDGGCMPEGGVCCDNGHYCPGGMVCEDGGSCSPRGDEEVSGSSASATGEERSKYSLDPVPDIDAVGDKGDGSRKAGGDEEEEEGDDDDDAGSIHLPSLLVGLLAAGIAHVP